MGKSSGSQGGGYQQYMDYQKYMPSGGSKNGGGQGVDYQSYMDYQKYMSQGGGKNESDATTNLVATDSHVGGYSKFYKDYVPHVKNWSNRDEVDAAFLGKYASSYARSPSPAKSA